MPPNTSPPERGRSRRRLLTAALGLSGIVSASLLVDGFLIEPRRLVSRSVTIPTAGIRSSPVRIFLFSDVNYTGPSRMADAIRSAAERFSPDLVLVAGDLLETEQALRRAEVVESAHEFLASLPGPSGRFLAPGEEEAPLASALREIWSDESVHLLSNTSRMVDVRGERVDLFVADPAADPPPWWIGREDGRSAVSVRGRHLNHILVYSGPPLGAWRDTEISFAFESVDAEALLELRFAWEGEPQSPTGPPVGVGWRLIRHEYRPDFRLYRYAGKRRVALEGRTESGFVPPAGAWCRARVRIVDDGAFCRVRARFWPEGAAEPTAWSIDARDASAGGPRNGTIALGARGGTRRYADLTVRGAGGEVQMIEPFSDPAHLRSLWTYRSALADWLGARADPGARPSARIVLAHNPDLVLDIKDIGREAPDLVMAGHTHGGQIRLPLFGALYTSTLLGRRYDRGLFRFEGIPMYITAGTGTSVVPIRLFDPPEVVLVTLVPGAME